jgi:steroid delta-isomerase-like uncharacterized protein
MNSDAFNDRITARLRTVDEHINAENRHDLDAIMSTFGDPARYDDEPWEAHYIGRDQVCKFYVELLQVLPDLQIAIAKRHACENAIVLEVVVSGRHMSAWRGLPATGAKVEFPLCAIYTFDDADRLAGEKIYYDRALILRQLGLFHEPENILGRISATVMHPLILLRILRHSFLRHWPN